MLKIVDRSNTNDFRNLSSYDICLFIAYLVIFGYNLKGFFCSAAKRSLSYIVGSGGGSGASGGIGVGVPWKRGGGGGSVLGYYDNPGFKRGSSLTSSINLAADNLDFVINDDDLEPGMHFTYINLSIVIVKHAFEDEILVGWKVTS